jgi:hypothetical protein
VKSGPEPEATSSPAAEPELPGEFVSEAMRADCARFLHDLRARTTIRRDSRLAGDWSPANRTNPSGRDGKRGQDG